MYAEVKWEKISNIKRISSWVNGKSLATITIKNSIIVLCSQHFAPLNISLHLAIQKSDTFLLHSFIRRRTNSKKVRVLCDMLICVLFACDVTWKKSSQHLSINSKSCHSRIVQSNCINLYFSFRLAAAGRKTVGKKTVQKCLCIKIAQICRLHFQSKGRTWRDWPNSKWCCDNARFTFALKFPCQLCKMTSDDLDTDSYRSNAFVLMRFSFWNKMAIIVRNSEFDSMKIM